MARHPNTRIPSLDGLRAVAIALVLFAHVSGRPGSAFLQAFHLTGDVGNLGVRIFFVLSGFLITSLLAAELDATKTMRFQTLLLQTHSSHLSRCLRLPGFCRRFGSFGHSENHSSRLPWRSNLFHQLLDSFLLGGRSPLVAFRRGAVLSCLALLSLSTEEAARVSPLLHRAVVSTSRLPCLGHAPAATSRARSAVAY